MKRNKPFTEEQVFQLALKIMDNYKFKVSYENEDNNGVVELTSDYMKIFLKVIDNINTFYN